MRLKGLVNYLMGLIVLCCILLILARLVAIPQVIVLWAGFLSSTLLCIMACGFTGWFLGLWSDIEGFSERFDLVFYGVIGIFISWALSIMSLSLLIGLGIVASINLVTVSIAVTFILIFGSFFVPWDKYWD